MKSTIHIHTDFDSCLDLHQSYTHCPLSMVLFSIHLFAFVIHRFFFTLYIYIYVFHYKLLYNDALFFPYELPSITSRNKSFCSFEFASKFKNRKVQFFNKNLIYINDLLSFLTFVFMFWPISLFNFLKASGLFYDHFHSFDWTFHNSSRAISCHIYVTCIISQSTIWSCPILLLWHLS